MSSAMPSQAHPLGISLHTASPAAWPRETRCSGGCRERHLTAAHALHQQEIAGGQEGRSDTQQGQIDRRKRLPAAQERHAASQQGDGQCRGQGDDDRWHGWIPPPEFPSCEDLLPSAGSRLPERNHRLQTRPLGGKETWLDAY
jgi:hypothetical protein